MKKESAIVRDIIAAVRQKYPRAYVRKIADRFTRGIPDVLIVVHCCWLEFNEVGVLFVETKTKTGRLSAIQKAEHAEIERAKDGLLLKTLQVIVARDREAVLAKLEEMRAV